MAKINASQMTLDTAKQIVADDRAARVKAMTDRFAANAAAIAKSPTTHKVGLAVGGAALGAGIYALLTSA